MNETVFLVITTIKELVPQNIIESMAMLLFVATCCSVMLIEIAIAMFIGNIASLIDRILPKEKVARVSNQTEASNKRQWFKKLVFWKKTN